MDDSALETRLASQEFDLERLNHLRRWWLQRMAFSARPLQEKMALFWHGILTSSFKKVGKGPQMLAQNELLRREGMGRYDTLLKSISRDPAMMIYLDSRSNKKAAPNENYSRELMELFSLGLGHFTEKDVRESARAFTGWQLKAKTEYFFNRGQHDYGSKTFLGRTGRFDGDDIVDIIMAQPAAAEYVCTRLWSFFAYPDPEPVVVSRLAAIFRENNTEIRPVVRAIFQAEEFYSEPRGSRAGERAGGTGHRNCANPRYRHRLQTLGPPHRKHGAGFVRPAECSRLAGRHNLAQQLDASEADKPGKHGRDRPQRAHALRSNCPAAG